MPAQRSFGRTRKPSRRAQHQVAKSTPSSPSIKLENQSTPASPWTPTNLILDSQASASSIPSSISSHLEQLRAEIKAQQAVLERKAAHAHSQQLTALQDKVRDANNALSAPSIPSSSILSSSSTPSRIPSSSMASSASHFVAADGVGLEVFEHRRPFLNIGNRSPDVLPLYQMFRAIDGQFISNIWDGTFKARDMAKLSNDFSTRKAMDDSIGTKTEFQSVAQLGYCMEMYGAIVVQLAHPDDREELTRSIAMYKVHLFSLFEHYTFDSIVKCHNGFIYSRICQGQDDIHAWRAFDPILSGHLDRKSK